MRTTITLDNDVVILVREEMQVGEGKTFKEAVNELIRWGRYAKAAKAAGAKKRPFKVRAYNMGAIRRSPDANR